MNHPSEPGNLDVLWHVLSDAYLADESVCASEMLAQLDGAALESSSIVQHATGWVQSLRLSSTLSPLEAFLLEYRLDTQEGLVLMGLAESLLRIPDHATADRLIEDALSRGEWSVHFERSGSLLVNIATRGLQAGDKLLHPEQASSLWRRLLTRLGEPVARTLLRSAMGFLGHQFVLGETIDKAIRQSRSGVTCRYSFDMLGEAAMQAKDVEVYMKAYSDAIRALAGQVDIHTPLYSRPGISVKLSALHPRYEPWQRERVLRELTPRLLILAQQAREAGISMTLDAEESERLMLSLELFAEVFRHPALSGWEGFGLALQAYQKRARVVIDWLAELSRQGERRIPLRLVKGAYWDSEIKRAQQLGLAAYPVFTCKAVTDVSYLACAWRIRGYGTCFYPQFATHNAHSIAAIQSMFGTNGEYEFQRLHGMGEAIYALVQGDIQSLPVRIYAPVGSHDQLLPYLVRRILENGANNSFVQQLRDPALSVAQVCADPVAAVRASCGSVIPLPAQLYGSERTNAPGVNLADEREVSGLRRKLEQEIGREWRAEALISGVTSKGELLARYDPANPRHSVGQVIEADVEQVQQSLRIAAGAVNHWRQTSVVQRADYLDRTAELLITQRDELIALLVREAGKTQSDAVAEWREAIDFCRYYAALAGKLFVDGMVLPGATGEQNTLHWRGRGIFVCISPWNFPLAILVGQIAAALVAGNVVLAKPARQTPLIAHRAICLMYQAGIPTEVLQLLPGASDVLGPILLQDTRVAGVAFTGSTHSARAINRMLAQRQSPIASFIAETGGINAMIADSSALPEQVVRDALRSAFNSAGQRCSALRILFVQEEIAPRVIDMLVGAMTELRLGDPLDPATDIGPVIDAAAQQKLEDYVARQAAQGRLLHRIEVPLALSHGCYVAPSLIELPGMEELSEEIFGPVLHLVRYAAHDLDKVVASINASGYGLTFGIHSRIRSRIEQLSRQVQAGNIYINRDMIGAVVGTQPFGGEGLSGTGFKAGGPHYLYRFASEVCVTDNIAALGGNPGLLAQRDY